MTYHSAKFGLLYTMDSTEELLRQLVIPLFAVTKTADWHPIGTSFVVAALGRQALLVTAGHNLDYFRKLVLPPARQHPSLPSFLTPLVPSKLALDGPELIALVRKRGQTDLAVYSHAAQVRGVDIALLVVSLPEGTACGFERAFAIDSTPVMPVGLPLTAIGYTGMSAHSEQNWEEKTFTAMANEGSLVLRSGKVLSSVEAGGVNRFTGIYLSTPFDSGMSGGPVIELRNEEPFVRAVITSDLSEDRSNQAAGSGVRAFASSIWMIAGLRAFGVNLEREDGTFEANPFVRDLIATNKIRDVGAAHKYVQIIEDIDGGGHRIQALNWIDPGVGQNAPKEVSTMPQSTQIYFVVKEVLEILLKNRGIHEGHWIPVVRFSTTGTSIGVNSGEPLPTAIIQVQEIGLQRVDEPVPGSVNAALVNPGPEA